MKTYNIVNLVGNLNRVDEMDKGGLNTEEMSDVFKAAKINISPSDIETLIRICSDLKTKKVTKRAVKEKLHSKSTVDETTLILV